LALGILCLWGRFSAPFVGHLGVEMAGGFLNFPTFLGFMGYLLQAGALKWSLQVTAL
jgi:hypothetical protein